MINKAELEQQLADMDSTEAMISEERKRVKRSLQLLEEEENAAMEKKNRRAIFDSETRQLTTRDDLGNEMVVSLTEENALHLSMELAPVIEQVIKEEYNMVAKAIEGMFK